MQKSDFQNAVLVQVNLSVGENNDFDEFCDLVVSAEFNVASSFLVNKNQAESKLYLGSGKVKEIKEEVDLHEDVVVVFNNSLAPSQQRNLEKILECPVMDRSELILDIFAKRARTHEGMLQVELAQLEHQSTRLIRGWTHLERQKGGIGVRGGPGETQLETDRRLISRRIKAINARLLKVRKSRAQSRSSRKRSQTRVIALVGYTNVGKSNLFNQLCDGDTYVKNQLFATLDPTIRKLDIPEIGQIVLVDTVGFIRGLPHALVDAFRATLEEVAQADLLLHVVDSHHLQRDLQIQCVQSVLSEIGAGDVKQLLVYNKIDLLDKQQMAPRIDYNIDDCPERVWLSAINKQGLGLLKGAIKELLSEQITHCCLLLKPDQGRLRAKLYANNAVVRETIDQHGDCWLEIKLPSSIYFQLVDFD